MSQISKGTIKLLNVMPADKKRSVLGEVVNCVYPFIRIAGPVLDTETSHVSIIEPEYAVFV